MQSVKKSQIKKLGIIAGDGDLPIAIIRSCLNNNIDNIIINTNENSKKLNKPAENYYNISIGKIGKIIETLKKDECDTVILVGGTSRPDISKIKLDKHARKLLMKLGKSIFGGDNLVLGKILEYITEQGFKITGVKQIAPEILAEKGFINGRKPKQDSIADIKIGFELINKISAFDVGQAVIIEQGRILGIEAAEGGTNKLIERCAKLRRHTGNKKPSAILVKGKKIGQSEFADLPTIGQKTINMLIRHNYLGMAIESGETIILNQEKIVELAKEQGLFIYGYSK